MTSRGYSDGAGGRIGKRELAHLSSGGGWNLLAMRIASDSRLVRTSNRHLVVDDRPS